MKRVICAIDCGPVINPAIVRAQMESGIIYGLSAALYGEITLANGAVEQSNFPDYDAVRLADAPAMTVHLVDTFISTRHFPAPAQRVLDLRGEIALG